MHLLEFEIFKGNEEGGGGGGKCASLSYSKIKGKHIQSLVQYCSVSLVFKHRFLKSINVRSSKYGLTH